MELYSMLCASLDGGVSGGEIMYACIWLSPFAIYLKLPQHSKSAMPQYKIKNLKFEKNRKK